MSRTAVRSASLRQNCEIAAIFTRLGGLPDSTVRELAASQASDQPKACRTIPDLAAFFGGAPPLPCPGASRSAEQATL